MLEECEAVPPGLMNAEESRIAWNLSQLSATTLDALKEFWVEQDAATKKNAGGDGSEEALNDQDIDQFRENWQLSQFWVQSLTCATIAALESHADMIWLMLLNPVR